MREKMEGTLKILGISFDVIEEEGLRTTDDAHADSNAGERWIRIDPQNSDDHKKELLWHEFAHMVLDLSGQSCHLEHGQEEAIAQIFGIALSQLVGDPRTFFDTPES